MYGPDLSPIFRGCLSIFIILSVIAIIGTYFGVRFFIDEPVIESKERIKPEIRLQVDDSGLGIDTIFVYKNK